MKTVPLWSWLIPALSLVLLVAAVAVGAETWLAVQCGAALVGAVIVAVHHAEVVAHRGGTLRHARTRPRRDVQGPVAPNANFRSRPMTPKP